jgi:8-oxo-dGTP diphosphatase
MSDRLERTYPSRPLVGVGAVIWDGQRVLLERRGQPPSQDAWAIPGGLIETGETTAEAVRREVREECGIEIEVGPLVGLFEPIEHDAAGRVRYHYVVLDFLAYFVSGDLRCGDDAAEVRWVTPTDLPAYHLAPATADMIRRGLAMVPRK